MKEKKNVGKMLKRFITFIITLCFFFSFAACQKNDNQGVTPKEEFKPIKNVIMMISDGMSMPATSLSRYALEDNEKGEKDLFLSSYIEALVKTTWAGGYITDSAPGATAVFTGKKSLAGAIGVDNKNLPRATLLEAAQKLGKAAGVVSTSEFMHATPGAIASHAQSRTHYEIIARQMLNQELDVYLGSGSDKLGSVGGVKNEFESEIESNGYTVVENRDEMEKVSGKVWGNFTSNAGKKNMSYDMDRVDGEPSLSEMTNKAISLLSKKDKGFFLLAEGSKIDWAAHDNDTIGIISEVLAYDKAFKAAVEFAKEDGETMVVSVSDHGNSGISMGSYGLYNYDHAPYSYLQPLRNATLTSEGAMLRFNGSNHDEVLKLYGINQEEFASPITDHERAVKALLNDFNKASKPDKFMLAKIMNEMAYIGYTTNGHTGEDVVLYVYEPGGYELKTILGKKGLIDNTEVNAYVSKCMGVNLEEVSSDLFVKVWEDGKSALDSSFTVNVKDFKVNTGGAKGYCYQATATITKGNKTAEIVSNKDEFEVNGAAISLRGEVSVYVISENSPGNYEKGIFYVPKQLLNLLNK